MTQQEFARLAAEIAVEDEHGGPEAPEWRRLVCGELTPEEAAALQARAGADPEAARDYDLYRPLEADVRARIARSLGQVRASARALSQAAPAKSRSRRRWPVVALGALPLAVAAAVAVVPGLLHPLLPVPAYVMRVGGSPAVDMAGPSEQAVPCLSRSGQLEVSLRPAQHVKGPLQARSFLASARPGAGPPRPWDVRLEPSEDGAFLLRGSAAQLLAGVAPGSWELSVAVGRPGQLPDAAGLGTPPPAGQGAWTVIRRTVEVRDRCAESE